MTGRPLQAAVCAVLAAILVVACSGGDDTVTPDRWVRDVCAQAVRFGVANDELGEEIDAVEGAEPAVVRDTFLSALSRRTGQIQEYRDAVEAMGAPDLRSGDAIFDAFLSRLDQSEDAANDLRIAIEALDPEDPEFTVDLAAALNRVEQPRGFDEELAEIADPIDDAAVVIAAVEADPACAEVIFASDDDPAARADAVTWGEGVCTASMPLAERSADVEERIDAAETLVEFHTVLLSGLEEREDLIGSFRDTIEELGPPAIEGGDDVLAAFLDRAEANEARSGDIADELKDLDPQSSSYEDDLNNIIERFPEPQPFIETLREVEADYPETESIVAAIRMDEDCAAFLLEEEEPPPEPTPTPTESGAVADAETWVSDVCGAFVDWQGRIDEALAELLAIEEVGSIEEVRDLFAGFLDRMVQETDAFVLDLGRAGFPDIADGRQIATAIELFARDLGGALSEQRDRAAELPTDDPDVFTEGIEEIEANLDADLEDAASILDVLDRFDTSEIDPHFDTLPECATLDQ